MAVTNRAEVSQRKTFTRVTPNMNQQQMAKAINENFDLLRNIFTSLVIYDDDNPRIVIGRGPADSPKNPQFGIFVGKEGENIITTLETEGS